MLAALAWFLAALCAVLWLRARKRAEVQEERAEQAEERAVSLELAGTVIFAACAEELGRQQVDIEKLRTKAGPQTWASQAAKGSN